MSDLLDFGTALDAVVVLDVQLSPNGEEIAYVTTGASTEPGVDPVGTLWLANVQVGSPRLFATSLAGNGSVRWSPDGTRLAFLSDREQQGAAQMYLSYLSSGEAICVTEHAGGVISLEWSPSGEVIALAVAGHKGAASPDDAKGATRLVDDRAPTTGLWLLTVSDVTASPAGPARQRRLTSEDVHVDGREFSWAPDSGSLIATVARSGQPHDLVTRKLVTIALSGRTQVLAEINSLPELGLRPRYSPDGSTIAFNGSQGSVLSAYSLAVIPACGGTPRVVAPGFAGSFWAFTWLPDGTRLLAVTQEKQGGRVVVVDIEAHSVTDAVERSDESRTVDLFALSTSADGRTLAFASASDSACSDVFVAEVGSQARQRTDLNPWTRNFEFGNVVALSWEASDGTEIEGLLTFPVGYQEGRPYPMLAELHGGPAGSWGHRLAFHCAQWGPYMAQRGYAVFRPNPRGSSGRGVSFQASIAGRYGELDLDDIIRGVDRLVELGIADPERLVVGGASGGGYLVNQMITRTTRFKAAVSVCGISNWVSFQGTTDIRALFDAYFGSVAQDPGPHWMHSPIRCVGRATTPTLIIFGECDWRVPPSQGSELYEGLKASGVEATLLIYPREGHAIMERAHQIDVLQRVVDWIDVHVPREAD